MPTVRLSQMRFSESTVSYSSSRFGKVVDELADVFVEIVVSIVGHAADAPRMTRQTRAKLSFEDLQNLFAFAQRPKQNGDGADVERVRREPEQVRSDAIEFGENRAQVMRARRNRRVPSSARLFPPKPDRSRLRRCNRDDPSKARSCVYMRFSAIFSMPRWR